MQPQIGYSQPYQQPSYNPAPESLQYGLELHQGTTSDVLPAPAQHQVTQQAGGQQLQLPYVQQPYPQDVQSTHGYGHHAAYTPYGQQGFQQMPGQQIVHAPAAIVGVQYCAQGEQVFFVNEKWASLSKDDFSILDSHKQPVFNMDSSAFSLKQKRVLKTAAGKAVCSLKKKVLLCIILLSSSPFSMSTAPVRVLSLAYVLCLQLMSSSGPTWFLSLGAAASDKERVAVIKKDTHNGAHSASMFLSSNTTQFFSQPVPDYQARGDVKNRSFFIYRGSMPVAEIMRSPSTSEKLTGANHYVLRVSHGTDYALMIAFCVVIDELFND
ncbi:hypothetical protein ABBQ32_010028 [Trebouxia sp. C0010 RCD-2024]